jgi:hypothetical protein
MQDTTTAKEMKKGGARSFLPRKGPPLMVREGFLFDIGRG